MLRFMAPWRPSTAALILTLGAAMQTAAASPIAGTTRDLQLPAEEASFQVRCQIAGPFATLRRANEVAAEARRRGYSAIAFHNGDGYYVRAC
ncbi:hypothetical protein KPL78_17790 [Roseomonas sp. HJA6]|uniref:SPOR domain-containing protein n=1 Tax=Roseomonas alba TaxID=2846776 RepID=A0ABS7ABP8_9PROT|nr:hypothetical protein [Neoroseomonas alba]MBW6399717.1 hypothetical protein [Neoroseomonas alba]